jgi:Kdo2-lipid IVA lauroyltransferase/acyltransferase
MFFLKLLSRLPFRLLYAFSDFLFFGSYYVVRYRRKLVRQNLENSFPEKSEKELKVIEKAFYKNLCDYGVETLKLFTISKEDLMSRMRFDHQNFLEQFTSQNQSIIFLASHQFNWEWMLVSASASFPMAIDFVYQPVNNPFFERFALITRTRFNAHPIQRDEVGRELVKRKNILRGIAIVADQYPGYPNDKKYPTTFLNRETVFFLGTNNIAIISQYPVVYYSIKKVKRGHYVATPHVVSMPPHDKHGTKVIENYVREVEKSIELDPPSWLWSHNRWKTRHIDGEW